MKGTARAWAYAAENGQGDVVRGQIDAESAQAAAVALRAKRLLPLSIRKAQNALRLPEFLSTSKARLSSTDLAEISRRLSDVFGASLPAVHALRLSVEQAVSPKQRAFLEDVGESVRNGRNFSRAVTDSDFACPRLFSALVAAGESAGSLGTQFERLAEHYEEAVKLKRDIVAQLLYPIALLILIMLTLLFLSFFILPQFEGVFAAADADPPPETRLVLAIGAAVREYWLLTPMIVIGLLAALRWAKKRYTRQFESARIATPFAGKLLVLDEVGRYLRTLSTLLQGGMPLVRAMPLARETLTVKLLDIRFHEAEDAVRVGERLGSALARAGAPLELVSYVEIGEETGDLAGMAGRAAARAEDKLRTGVKRVMILLAPLLTALMGLVTAGVIAAVMSGVLSLNEAVY
ncbi:MAG: type II secretion system F family protein [Amphiplicatus sp.]